MINTNLHIAAPGFKGYFWTDSEEVFEKAKKKLKGFVDYNMTPKSKYYTYYFDEEYDEENEKTVENDREFVNARAQGICTEFIKSKLNIQNSIESGLTGTARKETAL